MSDTDTRIQYIKSQVATTGMDPSQIEGYESNNNSIRKTNGWIIFLVLAVVIITLGWYS